VKHTLIVAVRGWTTSGDWLLNSKPGGEIRACFIDALERELPHSEVWAPELDMEMFSMRSAELLCLEIVASIRQKLVEQPHFESIVLLGYSAGSLLARRVFCVAHGADDSGELTQAPESWAIRIDRLVVLAGITRGWEFSSVTPAHLRFLSPVLPRLAALMSRLERKTRRVDGDVPLIWQLKRGSPFVVATRIQYVNVYEALRRCRERCRESPLRVDGRPSTIVVLGAQDEFLSPADCSELGPRTEFIFVEVGATNHAEALQIEDLATGSEAEAGKSQIVPAKRRAILERRKRLAQAVSATFTTLAQADWAIPAGDIDDYLDPMDLSEAGPRAAEDAARVDHAVMVVHGIRDHGFWTKRIAREIKTLGRERGIAVRAPTPSYGYFSMWDFVKPGGRDEAALWFMERYAGVKSHFPNADISFVGHSNGTYIAARALMLCPAIRFRNVVLAGSVVRRDYPWNTLSGRVQCVLNYVGSRDWVVAYLPAVFERLRLRWLDVGGAGAYGFHDAEPDPGRTKHLPCAAGPGVQLTEVRFVEGVHDAAIVEDCWKEIALFALFGQPPQNRPPAKRSHQWKRSFAIAPLVTILFVGMLVIGLTSPLSLPALVVWLSVWYPISTLGLTLAVASAVVAGMSIAWLFSRFLRLW